MIFSVGCDICDIRRIEKSTENPLFLTKNFTGQEIEYFTSKKRLCEHIAGHFAAKEAFAKSLGTGVRGFSLIDIEILHDKNGAPYFVLSDKLNKLTESLGIGQFHLSISHEKEYALAFVVAEKL